jgi:hypothetical protein
MRLAKHDEPMDLVALCESMKSTADAVASTVIDRWESIAEGEPWQALPPDLDHNHLPQLVRSLAAAGLCTDFDRELCRSMVHDSAEHGRHRANEGLGDALLYREYHLLRRALWQHMKDEHGETATVYYATMRIDALISLANSAALYGLNWQMLQADGRWPQVLDELLDEWPLPRA